MSITQSNRLAELNTMSVSDMDRDELSEFIELTDEYLWVVMEGSDLDSDRYKMHIGLRVLDAAKERLTSMCA